MVAFRRRRRRFRNVSSNRSRFSRRRRTFGSRGRRRYFFAGRDKASYSASRGMLYGRRSIRRRPLSRRQKFQVQLADQHGLHVYNTLNDLTMLANVAVTGSGSVGLTSQASLNRFALSDIQTQFALNDNGKIFITQQTDLFDLQNQTNSDVYLDIYQTVCKNDNGAGDIGTLYINGMSAMTGDSLAWTRPGFTPFDSTYLTRFHKILRVKKIKMKLGDRRQLIFNRRPYKFFNFNALDSITTNNFFRGLTYSYLFVITGTPIDQELTDDVNNGPAKVVATFSMKTYFKSIQSSLNIGHYSDNRADVITGDAYVVANADEQIVTN